MTSPIYFEIYNLFHQYIYGFETALTPDMTLTLTLLSTAASVFVVCLPFLVVLWVCKAVTR